MQPRGGVEGQASHRSHAETAGLAHKGKARVDRGETVAGSPPPPWGWEGARLSPMQLPGQGTLTGEG